MAQERTRSSPLEMSPEEFRAAGHRLVDRIADLLRTLPDRPVTTGEPPSRIRKLVGTGPLPETGSDAAMLLDETATLLFEHSLFNGHPRFWGYITSSPAPIGALADLLAASVNANVGAWSLAPVATEVERQAVRWIAELVGYPAASAGGGILVSGGNMANMTCFLAARAARAGWDIRHEGAGSASARRLRVYASVETHTWIQKAADMCGLGTDAIRWIPVDAALRMDTAALEQTIARDAAAGDRPFLVVGTAGSVGTGAIDPLAAIRDVARAHGLWFHVDGAYGAFAAALPQLAERFDGLRDADSLALDPHKWLYAPLEAGCALVRDDEALRGAFSYHPQYYKFDEVAGEETLNYNEYGPQNSRGFRALKVWLGLRQAGRSGFVRMIGDDVRLAEHLFARIAAHPELEACTLGLSIVTFRYVPPGIARGTPDADAYLDALNTEMLTRLQEGGEAFVSNAVVGGMYVLRACIVNFRTQERDVDALPDIVARIGRAVHAERRGRPTAAAV